MDLDAAIIELAAALRDAGVEVGSAGGEQFRQVVAHRLLHSNWLLAERAVAWDEGYDAGSDDEAHSARGIGAHDYAENPYRDEREGALRAIAPERYAPEDF